MKALLTDAVQRLGQIAQRPLDEARAYTFGKAGADAIAGATVAAVGVPQAMAFALIAGVRPIYGLYGLMVQLLIGSLITSVPRLSIGPTNTLSLLTASIATGLMPQATGEQYLQLVFVLAFVTGVLQLALAGARLGSLVRYVSHSVVVGFTAGAGVLIAAKQLPNFMGLPAHRAEHRWPGLTGIAQDFIEVAGHWNWRAIVIGTFVVAVVVMCRRISRLVPGPFIAVVAASLIVVGAGWHEPTPDRATAAAAPAVPLIHELPKAAVVPTFHLWSVPWDIRWDSLFGGAVALALVGLLEGVAIARSLTARSGALVNANQEFLAQGMTNTLSSFFQCYPGTASFSRSALNDMAGAATRWAGVMTSAMVLVLLVVAGPLARFIPLSALAGILIVVAWGLVDFKAFSRMRQTHRADAVVCIATFACTLFIPLEYAVFVGVALNLALYLRRASRLKMSEMIRAQGGPFQERPITDSTGERSVVFLSLEGDLFFGVADELHEQLTRAVGSGVRVVILRLKRTHMIDATALRVLEQFVQNMHDRGGYVLLCGVTDAMHDKLRGHGLARLIGENHIFETRFGVFASAKAALRRARELVGHSIDADSILAEDEVEDEAERRAAGCPASPEYEI